MSIYDCIYDQGNVAIRQLLSDELRLHSSVFTTREMSQYANDSAMNSSSVHPCISFNVGAGVLSSFSIGAI